MENGHDGEKQMGSPRSWIGAPAGGVCVRVCPFHSVNGWTEGGMEAHKKKNICIRSSTCTAGYFTTYT